MEGKGTVVVTGAARGIGAAIAGCFLADGWSPLLVDLSPEVEATAARLGHGRAGAARACVADVTSAEGRNQLCEAVRAGEAPLRALVNNAGITRDSLLRKMSEEQMRAVLRVNLGAAYELSLRFAEQLEGQGAIVSLSSKSASGNVGQYNYAVSKAGLLGLTRSLAIAFAPRIRVNALAPAFIATEMTDAIPAELREKFISRIPFARAGTPNEVAAAALWLSGPEASYVTGQTLAVCGGRSFGA
ncbi:MAG TPA: SDR family oxidoreductase [Solirubrobacterales bacterium]